MVPVDGKSLFLDCDPCVILMYSSKYRFPDQRLTRIEALRGEGYSSNPREGCFHAFLSFFRLGMTIEPAFASFSEADFGSLVPGKIADYVVLSQDIMTIPEDKILDTRVLATVLDGRPSYGEI